jgi:hypothetical protein
MESDFIIIVVTGVVEVRLRPVFDRAFVQLLDVCSPDNDVLKHKTHAAVQLTVLAQL